MQIVCGSLAIGRFDVGMVFFMVSSVLPIVCKKQAISARSVCVRALMSEATCDVPKSAVGSSVR